MASRNAGRPNVMVILTDDQGPWAMGCAGNDEIRTPNLDRLAGSGVRFTNFFCSSPVCSPARASLLTGRIPSQHGVHDWLRAGNSTIEPDNGGELIEYLAGMTGYSDILAANGYACGFSGKWHLGDCHHAQKGFGFWEVHAKGGGPYYNAPMVRDGEVYEEPAYVTDVITDNAIRFLDGQVDDVDEGRPFYVSVHYTAPHGPWGREHHPEDVYSDYYDNCPFTSVPQVAKHPWGQGGISDIGEDPTRRREALSGYFAATTCMDVNVGRLLDWLEAHGLRENTLVLFTSDNGMNMGHHGIYGKGNGTFPMNMYDTSVKVPAIVSRPGHVPTGEVCEAMVSHYDFMPTLLDYLAMDNPEAGKLPGKSFAPLLRGEPCEQRQDVVVFDEYGPVRMIRTRDWKYIHRYPYGQHELYDLASDPNEETNLVDSEVHADTLAELKARLEDWFVRYVNPALDGTHEAVNGNGQIRRAGPGAEGKPNYAGKVRSTWRPSDPWPFV